MAETPALYLPDELEVALGRMIDEPGTGIFQNERLFRADPEKSRTRYPAQGKLGAECRYYRAKIGDAEIAIGVYPRRIGMDAGGNEVLLGSSKHYGQVESRKGKRLRDIFSRHHFIAKPYIVNCELGWDAETINVLSGATVHLYNGEDGRWITGLGFNASELRPLVRENCVACETGIEMANIADYFRMRALRQSMGKNGDLQLELDIGKRSERHKMPPTSFRLASDVPCVATFDSLFRHFKGEVNRVTGKKFFTQE